MSLRSSITRFYAQPLSWLRAIVHRGQLEDEMEAELAFHLENLTEELIRSGLSPDDAGRRARIAMGSMLTSKEEMRGSLGLGWWDALWADVRYGLRILGKSPGFTAIAVISLALAIGANTTIFSVAKQLLYDRLVVPDATSLQLLAWTGHEENLAVHSIWGDYSRSGGRATSTAFSYSVYQQLRAENRVLGDLFAFKTDSMNATIRGTAERVESEMVSGNYYSQLGVVPVLGRGITPADDVKPGAGWVAVISYGLWERDFGRSPDVLGQTIRVNDTPVVIVGVNPKGFTSASDVQTASDIFLPLHLQPRISPKPRMLQPIFDQNEWWVNIMGRAKPGIPDATAQAALDTQLAAAVRGTMSVKKDENIPRMDLRDGSRGLFEEHQQYGKPMAILMAFVGLVLLLACANIANLMLARGAQRQREMSVRLALGAGRMRILRQMLVESLLLATAGGACGCVLAYLGRNAIPKMLEKAWERNGLQVHFDWGIFAFTAAVTIGTGVLFGLAPAIAAARANVSCGLKSTALTATRRRKGLSARMLVGFQIALSTLLVISAGLFLRTLAGLRSVDVGFRTDHLLVVDVNAPHPKYSQGKDIAFHQKMEAGLAAVPGVQSIAPAEVAYIENSRSMQGFTPEGHENDRDRHPGVLYNVVGTNFFTTMRIPIIAGRSFGSQDTVTSVKVGVINQSLARARFGNENPLNRRFEISEFQNNGQLEKEWIEIVGICADTRYTSLREPSPPQFFLPYVQRIAESGMSYMIRTAVTPEAIVPGLQNVARQTAPDIPLSNVRTEGQQIDAAMQQERLFVTLTSGFGLLALALASVGIYGIMAYSVAQRTNEIGVRLAVGAQPWQVRALILKESTWLTVAGIAAGTAAALGLCRLVKSMLYGIRPDDPATVVAGILILLGIALAASWIPARRAAAVQPIEALRHE
jgi:predicted permease